MPDIPEAVISAAAAAIHRDACDPDADHEATGIDRRRAVAALEAAAPLLAGEPVTEHAHLMSSGGFHVWNTKPYIEEIFPLAERIKDGQRFGGKVYRRRVIVVEDWTEVPKAEEDGGS